MIDTQVDCIVIGAGLTGLTLAYYLQKEGKKVAVIEKSDHIGGVIETIQEDGFIFEKGPNTGIIGSPELVELFDDLSNKITVEIADDTAKYRWIWKGGQWNALPSGLISAISTPLFSLMDKFRILGEPFRKPGSNPDESVAALVKRRLGESFLNYAVDPFIGGIYAGNPNVLVTRYALPKLYNLEQNYGSFIRGAIKKRKEPKSDIEKRVSREVFSVKGGLHQLIDALSQSIGSTNFYKSINDLKIDRISDRYSASFASGKDNIKIHADKVITTINGDQLESIFPFVPNQMLQPISDLVYAKVVQVVSCYKQWQGKELKAFGGLIPSLEKRMVLGILFPSSLFDGRSPEGGAILSIFMGGIRKPEMIDKTDDELKSIALSEVRETLGHMKEPDTIRIFRYFRAIPQYDINSGKRLEAIDNIQKKFPGLTLAGNIRDGIGIPDRVKQAKQIAILLNR